MARSFDGSADYLDIAHEAAVDVGTSDFTVGLWLKSSTAPTDGDRLVSKGTSSGGIGAGVRYEVFRSGGNFAFAIDDNTTKRQVNHTSLTDLSDGNWHLWMFERDSGSTIKIFEDGNTERKSLSESIGSIDNGNSLIVAAGRTTGDTVQGFWPGNIADFFLIKRLLTGAEKDSLANGVGIRVVADGEVFIPVYGRSPEPSLISELRATVNGSPSVVDHVPVAAPLSLGWGQPDAEVTGVAAEGFDSRAIGRGILRGVFA